MRSVSFLLLAVAVSPLSCNDHHNSEGDRNRDLGSELIYDKRALPDEGSINTTPTTTKREIGRCGPGYGSCESGFCCSEHGYCGVGEAYCGVYSNSKIEQRASGTAEYNGTIESNYTIAIPIPIPIPTRVVSPTSGIPRLKVGIIPYAGEMEIRHCTQRNVVALTFDDGPSAYTSDLLDLLDRYNAKATFFITGNNNGIDEIDDCKTGYPAIIKRMHASGHQIASHTWSHPDLSGLTEEEFNRQMFRNEKALRDILGIIPTYMRPPYISCDSTCAQRLDKMGYHNIYFDVDSVDYWNNDAALIQNSKDNIANALAAKSWDPTRTSFLIIQHDIHFHSVYSLTEYILKTMKEAGYGTSVTVGSCLGDPRRNWYRNAGPATLDC